MCAVTGTERDNSCLRGHTGTLQLYFLLPLGLLGLIGAKKRKKTLHPWQMGYALFAFTSENISPSSLNAPGLLTVTVGDGDGGRGGGERSLLVQCISSVWPLNTLALWPHAMTQHHFYSPWQPWASLLISASCSTVCIRAAAGTVRHIKTTAQNSCILLSSPYTTSTPSLSFFPLGDSFHLLVVFPAGKIERCAPRHRGQQQGWRKSTLWWTIQGATGWKAQASTLPDLKSSLNAWWANTTRLSVKSQDKLEPQGFVFKNNTFTEWPLRNSNIVDHKFIN